MIFFFSDENKILQNPHILGNKLERFRLIFTIYSKFSDMRIFGCKSWTWNRVYWNFDQEKLEKNQNFAKTIIFHPSIIFEICLLKNSRTKIFHDADQKILAAQILGEN